MERKEILKTITVIVNAPEVAEGVIAGLENANKDLDLIANLTIIMVENTTRAKKLSTFDGISIAFDLLTKEPIKKILLYHVTPLDYIKQKHKLFNLVAAKPNVRFLEMPFTPEDIISVFETKPTAIAAVEVARTLDSYINGQLRGIWHDIKKAADPLNPEPGWATEMVNSGIQKAKETFPALTHKDNAFIIEFLKEASANREEVRKGERIDGVFCDMEGTLFINNILNEPVLNYLKDASATTLVTLWTDGDLTQLYELLRAHNIHYPLYAKRDYAGAIVEMVIDDMDEVSFTATTKIYPAKFLQTKNITA